MDVFVVPTLTSRMLFVFAVLARDRRQILHVNVNDHPTPAWTAPQLRNAFPWDSRVWRSQAAPIGVACCGASSFR